MLAVIQTNFSSFISQVSHYSRLLASAALNMTHVPSPHMTNKQHFPRTGGHKGHESMTHKERKGHSDSPSSSRNPPLPADNLNECTGTPWINSVLNFSQKADSFAFQASTVCVGTLGPLCCKSRLNLAAAFCSTPDWHILPQVFPFPFPNVLQQHLHHLHITVRKYNITSPAHKVNASVHLQICPLQGAVQISVTSGKCQVSGAKCQVPSAKCQVSVSTSATVHVSACVCECVCVPVSADLLRVQQICVRVVAVHLPLYGLHSPAACSTTYYYPFLSAL